MLPTLPSKKKYVSKPPLPSSLLNIISLSSALLVIYKSPSKLSITESVPLCEIDKSPSLPNKAVVLFVNKIFLENLVLSALPSIVIYVAKPPLPSSDLNIISLSAAFC